MRVVQNNQMTIGEVDVSQIKFDTKSRDDIPKILRGRALHFRVRGQLTDRFAELLTDFLGGSYFSHFRCRASVIQAASILPAG